MLVHTRDRRCVIILLPPGTELSDGGARLLVRYAQHRCGAAPWGKIAVDLFHSDGETLVLARPAEGTEAVLADYALPFVHNYFID